MGTQRRLKHYNGAQILAGLSGNKTPLKTNLNHVQFDLKKLYNLIWGL